MLEEVEEGNSLSLSFNSPNSNHLGSSKRKKLLPQYSQQYQRAIKPRIQTQGVKNFKNMRSSHRIPSQIIVKSHKRSASNRDYSIFRRTIPKIENVDFEDLDELNDSKIKIEGLELKKSIQDTGVYLKKINYKLKVSHRIINLFKATKKIYDF